MGQIVLLSFASAANPTLIAVSTVMLLLPNPQRLMVGYLCGALLTSITLGLIIVFSLSGSGTVSTTRHTLGPAADLALGALALLGAFVIGSGRDQRLAARRARKRAEKRKGPPRWERTLSKGSPRATFLIGAVLTLPGASYLVGLRAIHRQGYGTFTVVVVVLAFNVVMLLLLELPLAGFVFAPDWTPKAIDRAKTWVGGHWHRYAVVGLSLVGAALVIKGLLTLLT